MPSRRWVSDLQKGIIALGAKARLTFDFTGCRRLPPSAIAFLGGLARTARANGGTAVFSWPTCTPAVLESLRENGFAAAFGGPAVRDGEHAIPYREDQVERADEIVDYLSSAWLGRGWMSLSELLKNAVVGRVWEVYANAFEHGKSRVGIFSCGQHSVDHKEISLTVLDFGVSIPENVRAHARRRLAAGHTDAETMRLLTCPPQEALEWAFRRGTTTQVGGISRGLGLDLLRNFVKINGGRLECLSGEGYVVISQSGEEYERVPPFRGTALSITLICDARKYILASEALPQRPLF